MEAKLEKGLELLYLVNGRTQKETITQFPDLKKYYINHYKKQMAVMREVSKRLDIISKISFKENSGKEALYEIIEAERPKFTAYSIFF
jgi:hypothetical protein